MNTKELHTISFHRENMLKRPSAEDLPTIEDADEHKLLAMDKLLRMIFEFQAVLVSIGIPLQEDKYDKHPIKNTYRLQDTEYKGWARFKIIVQTNWFNARWRGTAIHGGFDFYLYLIQDGYQGRGELADWIRINIKHLNTALISLASSKEHVRALDRFLKNKEDSYFYDIPMTYSQSVIRDINDDGMSFKTEAFNEAVYDACKVLQKIIDRKQFLEVSDEKE